jgi:BirA family biotin operon repressor/biotin-[acetyl-CoA-carboxylase] ligase
LSLNRALAVLDLPTIESLLQTRSIGRPINFANELWESIDSTNTRARDLAAQGAPMGTLVLARKQTAGRGRLGRAWESPQDTGIYMSLILRSGDVPAHAIPLLTIAAGVAIAEAVEQSTGVKIGLKWVNDLICDGCKVGGILAEASGGKSPYVVLGMGVNVMLEKENMPEELQGKVTSLHLHSTNAPDPNAIVVAICSRLEALLNDLESGLAPVVLERWKNRSVTIGERVRATVAEKTIEGKAVDVTGCGALKVQQDDGKIVELSAGEIQIRRADGAYC